MAQRGDNNILPILLVVGGIALIAYTTMQNTGNQFNTLGPGQSYSGFTNNTGAAVYIDAAGNVIDSLGNLIATIISATNNNNNTGNDSPFFNDEDMINGKAAVNASYYCQRPENRYKAACNPMIKPGGFNPSRQMI